MPGRAIEALLEADLGTERTSRFLRKVATYCDLYRDGIWRRLLPVWPLVLTVTATEERAMALRRATAALLAAEPDHEALAKGMAFAFAPLVALQRRPGPLGSVWGIAGTRGTSALVPEVRE